MKKHTGILASAFIILAYAGSLQAGYWAYRPMSVNAKKGDIILSAEAGMTEDIIRVVSGHWEHVGMVVDNGFTVRHNTKYMDSADIEWNYINLFFTRIKTTPKRLNPDQLANGMPGMISEDVNTAFNGERARFHAAGGIFVSPNQENESAYRPALGRAADRMKYLDGYYRISSYANMFQQYDVNYRVKGRGGMCASAVWFANYYSGKRMNYAVYSPELSMKVASVIYTSVINMIHDDYGVLGKIFFGIQEVFGTGLDRRIANQVVNAFGHDRPDDLTDYWRTHPITAVTVSPDNLLMASFVNPGGKQGGVQAPGSSFYERVEPVRVMNGYWYWVE